MASTFSRKKISKCVDCPLDGLTKVSGRCDWEGHAPRMVIIGEAPGAEEDEQGKPFVGPAGRLLKKDLHEAGILPHTVHFTNVVGCRPPDNKINSADGQQAILACSSGFRAELRHLVKAGIRVIVPVGSVALHALGIEGGITKARGSVYEIEISGESCAVVPSFHPSYILRGQSKEEVTLINDLAKADSIVRNGWTRPREDFNVNPTLGDVRRFVAKAQEADSVLGLDIETTSLDPATGEILCVGLADSSEHALVIPFYSKGLAPYWSKGDLKKVRGLLTSLLSSNRVVIQNALFDARYLEVHGFPVRHIEHDILLIHHAVHPELPHNLGYIVSVYGQTPFWKDVVLGSSDKLSEIEDEVLRTYNARDCVVLLQVLGPLLSDLKDTHTTDTYQTSLDLVKPVLQMFRNGLPIDEPALKKWRAKTKRDLKKVEKELREKIGLPPEFNLGSPDDLRYLIHGIAPLKVRRARDTLVTKYGPDSKLSRDTKKYADLVKTVAIVSETKHLYLTKSKRRTSSGKLSTDGQALLGIQISAANRVAELSSKKKLSPQMQDELADIERLMLFLKLFRQYQDLSKILSTYTKFPVSPDGRVRGQYLIHGTATGRLSSRKPNMQNIPPSAQLIFKVSDENRTLVKADYSNLELRVLSELADDVPLKELFKEGKNVHDQNTKDLFGISEKNPKWASARKASKRYIFGRNYGGSVRGIFEKVALAVPDLGLTFSQFAQADQRFRRAHPAIAKWSAKTIDTVRSTRTLYNAFGRVRFFLGRPDEIERAGLNFPIQSTAADILNFALIKLGKTLPKGALLCGTVHDSVIVECGKSQVRAVVKILKAAMEAPTDVNGNEVSFPVDIEVGDSWGSMNEYSVRKAQNTRRK